MTEKDVSISVLRANLVMFALTVPLLAALGLVFSLVWGPGALAAGFNRLLVLTNLLLVVVIGVPLHELLHAAGWMLFGKKSRREIRFGFQWKLLTPYAHLETTITAYGYRMGTLLPGLALGLVPYVIGLALGNGWLAVLGLFFLFAAGGDLLMLWIIRDLRSGAIVRDHPSRVGCIIVEH